MARIKKKEICELRVIRSGNSLKIESSRGLNWRLWGVGAPVVAPIMDTRAGILPAFGQGNRYPHCFRQECWWICLS